MATQSRLGFASLVCISWLSWTAASALPADDDAASQRLQPVATAAWTPENARHLLFRAGLGGSSQDVQAIYKLGPVEAVNQLVDYGSQPALDLPLPSAAELPEPAKNVAKLTPEEKQQRNLRVRRDDQQRVAELRAWWIRRMIESPRPLEEKLTLFW